jgi:hypothetical protein
MLQWALDRTSKDVIGVSRDFLIAATSDNVQPLALIACERFGAGVAMSPESCHKAYLMCTRDHDSATLSFLKATIGYRRGDCGWQLAQSDAGLRFLGLAACLLPMGAWPAARVLHGLIQATASDKQLVPTAQHLKHLMLALEDKLALSAFPENVVGWALLIGDGAEKSHTADGTEGRIPRIMEAPIKATIELTQALSCLARVGEQVGSIEITASIDGAAWFVAFVKWCLGEPPTIVFPDGRTLASDSSAAVTLRLTPNKTKSQEVRVDLHEHTGKINNLVNTAESIADFRGMVGVGTYGQATLRRLFGGLHGILHRACAEALPYACFFVRQNLSVCREASLKYDTSCLDPELEAARGQVFPSPEKIAQILHDYLGTDSEDKPSLLVLPRGLVIEDLPLMSLAKSKLRQDCPCPLCLKTSTTHATHPPNHFRLMCDTGKRIITCKFRTFIYDVCHCATEVLALSLLNPVHPDGAKVYFGNNSMGSFTRCVRSMLVPAERREKESCSVSDILETAVKLLGHEPKSMSAWVASSHYGQTLYPRLFSTQTVQNDDILALECVPGILRWRDNTYSTVQVSPLYETWDLSDDDSDSDSSQGLNPTSQPRVQTELYPTDAFAGYDLEWQLAFTENAVNVAILQTKFPTRPGRNPRHVLDAAAESLFVSCIHDRMAPVTPGLLHNIYLTQPIDPTPRFSGSVGVVQSDKNEQIRFFTLATGRRGIIRMDSCLECCVRCSPFFSLNIVIC